MRCIKHLLHVHSIFFLELTVLQSGMKRRSRADFENADQSQIECSRKWAEKRRKIHGDMTLKCLINLYTIHKFIITIKITNLNTYIAANHCEYNMHTRITQKYTRSRHMIVFIVHTHETNELNTTKCHILPQPNQRMKATSFKDFDRSCLKHPFDSE